MKTKFFFLVLTCCIGLGCSSLKQAIVETPGFSSGFDQLSTQNQQKVQFVGSETTIPTTSKKVIQAVNGQQIYHQISHSKKASLVYFWSLCCTSDICIDPSVVLQYCLENNIEFILVMEYLTPSFIDDWETKSYADCIYLIDFRYYQTDYCPKYLRKFKREVFAASDLGKSPSGRFFLFESGKMQPFEYSVMIN